jgi:hypothetical protein
MIFAWFPQSGRSLADAWREDIMPLDRGLWAADVQRAAESWRLRGSFPSEAGIPSHAARKWTVCLRDYFKWKSFSRSDVWDAIRATVRAFCR